MPLKIDTEPLVEIDRTPRYFVSGLGRLVPMQCNTLLSYYLLHPRPGAAGGMERRLEVELIIPTEAIAQAIDLAVVTLGPRAAISQFERLRMLL